MSVRKPIPNMRTYEEVDAFYKTAPSSVYPRTPSRHIVLPGRSTVLRRPNYQDTYEVRHRGYTIIRWQSDSIVILNLPGGRYTLDTNFHKATFKLVRQYTNVQLEGNPSDGMTWMIDGQMIHVDVGSEPYGLTVVPVEEQTGEQLTLLD